MAEARLFPQSEGCLEAASGLPPEKLPGGGTPRLPYAQRNQLRWEALELDTLSEPEHRVHAVWAFVAQLDLTRVYNEVQSRNRRGQKVALEEEA